jgi:hypothetical protein
MRSLKSRWRTRWATRLRQRIDVVMASRSGACLLTNGAAFCGEAKPKRGDGEMVVHLRLQRKAAA